MTEVVNKHWFLVAYAIPVPGSVVTRTVIAGLDTMEVTVPVMNELRQANELPEFAVATTVSYLGWMSQEKMEGSTPVQEPVPAA